MNKRDRSNLTSIQVTFEQKNIIDEAWSQYSDSKQFISRGKFLTLMCLNLLQGKQKQEQQVDLDSLI